MSEAGEGSADRGGASAALGELASDAWQWGLLLGRPMVATIATTFLTFLSRVIMLRVLPIGAAGEFALLLAIPQFLTPAANLGQWSLILRRYSRSGEPPFNWPVDLRNGLLLGLSPALLGTWAAREIYDLTGWHAGFILSCSLLNLAILHSAYKLASQRNYIVSNVLIRMPGGLMIIPAAAMLAIPDLATLDFSLAVQLLCFCITLLASLLLLARHLPRGHRTLSLRERMHAVAFLPAPFLQAASDDGLIAVAGAVLEPASIALFAAYASLFRPLRLMRQISNQVLTSELARRAEFEFSRFLAGWLTAAVVVGLAANLAGPRLSQLFYGERYAAGLNLIPWLALAGAANLSEALPQGLLMGRGRMRLNALLAIFQVAIILGGLGLGVALSLSFGVAGAAVASAAIHLCRSLISHALWWWSSRQGHQRSG